MKLALVVDMSHHHNKQGRASLSDFTKCGVAESELAKVDDLFSVARGDRV